MDSDGLKAKASELWEVIVKLETEKYDLEERQKRQDYDVRNLWIWNHLQLFIFAVERIERKTKTTEQTESY